LYLRSHALHGFLLFDGVDYGVRKFNEFFSPLGEVLFFACTKRKPLRNSGSRWPKASVNPALLGAADGDPENLRASSFGRFNKKIRFLNRPN
jgi:hypothetical protein